MIIFPYNGWKVTVPFSLTQTATAVDAANVGSYSFATQAIGAADATRYVIVGIASRGNAGSPETVSSCTVGGVAASLTFTTGNGADSYLVEFWQAAVPTGTTATVDLVFTGTMTRAVIVLWRLVGANPTATSTGSDNAATSNAVDASLTIPTGGAGIGLAWTNGTAGNPRTYTWTNMTEGTDATAEGDATYTSAISSTAGAATRTATASGALSSSAAAVLGLVAWGP